MGRTWESSGKVWEERVYCRVSGWVGPCGIHIIPIRACMEMYGTYIEGPIMSGANSRSRSAHLAYFFQHTVHDDLTLIAPSPIPFGSCSDKSPPCCELRQSRCSTCQLTLGKLTSRPKDIILCNLHIGPAKFYSDSSFSDRGLSHDGFGERTLMDIECQHDQQAQ